MWCIGQNCWRRGYLLGQPANQTGVRVAVDRVAGTQVVSAGLGIDSLGLKAGGEFGKIAVGCDCKRKEFKHAIEVV
jgi:hypothetical protein